MPWTHHHVKSLMFLLSFLVVLVILSHQNWLTSYQWQRDHPIGRLLRFSTKGNRSSMLFLWRDVPDTLDSPKNTAGSPREDAPTARGVKGQVISLVANASVSEVVRLGHLLTTENYPYIINEPDKCPEEEPAPFLVLLIATEAWQVEARDAIRQTWGNKNVAPGLGFICLFLLGVKEGEPDGEQRSRLKAESRQHRDIIQQDYLDSYYNLTVKTMMGMRWVATYCPHASYVMKTDNDMFVNTEYLIHKLLRSELTPKVGYFTGCLMMDNSPIRKKDNKWYMPPEIYPGERYPAFSTGSGYILSGDLVGRVYRASLSIRLLHLEDVYMGLCLAMIGVKPTIPPIGGLFNNWRVPYTSCRYRNLITSHAFSPDQLLWHWINLQSNKHNAC